jgi:hypothetical protein
LTLIKNTKSNGYKTLGVPNKAFVFIVDNKKKKKTTILVLSNFFFEKWRIKKQTFIFSINKPGFLKKIFVS